MSSSVNPCPSVASSSSGVARCVPDRTVRAKRPRPSPRSSSLPMGVVALSRMGSFCMSPAPHIEPEGFALDDGFHQVDRHQERRLIAGEAEVEPLTLTRAKSIGTGCGSG